MATAPKPAPAETPLSGYDWPAIIKDLIGTAAITFLILTPIVSFRTILDQGNLSLTTRWPLALGLTLLVVLGRLLLHLFLWRREGAPAAPSILPSFFSEFSSIGKYVAPALLVIAVLLPVMSGGDKRTIDLAIYILTYVMLGWGLNIVVGLAGLLDLGYVAFYAVGAYAYALLSTIYLPLWFAMALCRGPFT
jgi:branched-chain amino acid transport system permease protein